MENSSAPRGKPAVIRTFRDLIVWQKSMQLVTQVYRLTDRFPADERFGLTSQVRRSAVSLPSNIAEGHGRGSRKEYARSLRIAMGSLCELETQLEISKNLGLIDLATFDAHDALIREIDRMLSSLIRKVSHQSTGS